MQIRLDQESLTTLGPTDKATGRESLGLVLRQSFFKRMTKLLYLYLLTDTAPRSEEIPAMIYKEEEQPIEY